MFDAVLPSQIDFAVWRALARQLRLADAPPEAVAWRTAADPPPLLAEPPPSAPATLAFTAPRAFLDLAQKVLLHRSPARFDLLYRLLWRLKATPRLIEIASDADVSEALKMQQAVSQAIHKMHAFVRFRVVEEAAHEAYVAWFEPPHRVTEAAAPWFVRRMANLRFSILTPDVAVHWDRHALTVTPGVEKAPAPGVDQTEDHWRAYYAAIFNPARLNPRAMTQHMARKYWRNLPEAALIADLVAGAQGRTENMVQAPTTQPSKRAAIIAQRRGPKPGVDGDIAPKTLEEIANGLQQCRRCSLWRDATQGVPGEGPAGVTLMLVGEQPGDHEDLAGHPFVGPAGAMLNKALAEAGAPRGEFYITNAVKHFKHEMRGKRRLHKMPDAAEVRACRWWLDKERRLVGPKVVVVLGATAAAAVLGRAVAVAKERGTATPLDDGSTAFVTVHPSYLLRIPDPAARAAAYTTFVADLKAAYALTKTG